MNDAFSIQLDADAERRRALAKVYSLLIRLAEKSEKPILLESQVDKGKVIETSKSETRLEISTKEANSEERSK